MEPTGSDDKLQHAQAADAARERGQRLGRTLAKGAVAGVVATSTMVAVRDLLYANEDPAVRKREERLREGAEDTPLQRPLRKAANAAGKPLDSDTERKVGRAMAWGMGIGGVVAYAALRERWPTAGAGLGTGFGVAAWALEDELLMGALDTEHAPTDYPWQAHARGLAAHVAYGVAAESTLRALDRAW